MKAPAARDLLILDDDPLVGLLIETVARMAGVPVRLTQRHEDFFSALDASPPTHIMLDLTLPGFSGEQVLDELARRRCQARIIVSSGADAERLTTATARAAAQGLHLAGVLPKPFAPAALRQMLA